MISFYNNLSKNFKNIFYLSSSNLIQSFISFFANLILIYILSPKNFGEYAIITAAFSIIFLIFSLRTETLIIKEKTFDNQKKNQIEILAGWEIIIGFTISLILLFYAKFDYLLSSIVIFNLIFQKILNFKRAYVEREMKYSYLSIAELFGLTISQLIAILLAISNFGSATLFLRDSINILITYFLILFFFKNNKFRIKFFKKNNILNIFNKIKYIYLDQLSSDIIFRMLIIIGNFYFTNSQIGYLYQARRLAIFPAQIISPFINRFCFNFFSRSNYEISVKFFYKSFLFIFLYHLFVYLVIFFIIEKLITYVYGNEWAQISTIIILIYLFFVSMSFKSLIRSFIYPLNKDYLMVISQFLEIILFACFIIILDIFGLLSFNIYVLAFSLSAFISLLYLLLKKPNRV